MSDLEPSHLPLLTPVILYGMAALVALSLGRVSRIRPRLLTATLLVLGAGSGVAIALEALLSGGSRHASGWEIIPAARVSLNLDPLAAFFLLVISMPAIAIAAYGLGYLSHAHGDGDQQSAAATDALLGAFLASMSLVVLADGVFGFLIAWELMALVSFFLVVGNGHQPGVLRAGYIYIVMTHIGTGFLILAFLLLARQAGSFEFAAFRESAAGLGNWERDAIFLLSLLGFGTKMGLIPLHVWLPRAHPVAPSHVSALMSGVMVKTAVFGLIRVAWEFAGPGPSWWGVLLIAVGAGSAVLGILYALMERDLKRVLAYSTVEHLGIITVGLGAALLADAGGHPVVAALALTAALVHVLNHSIFKGLLFLGAGAVQTGTGTRDLERLGGLIKRMPWTAVLFLTGSLAVAALPPLNGFAGEWLLFQALLDVGSAAGTVGVATPVAIAAGTIALTGALALACFVRAFGIGFLAQPRSDGARRAREVDATMISGMGLLGIAALGLGLFPGAVVRLLRPVTDDLVGAQAHPSLGTGDLFDAAQLSSAYAPLLVVAGLVVVGIIPWLVARLATGQGRSRVAPTWVCGIRLEPRMQYSATGFAKPIRLIFQALIRPRRSVDVERPASEFVVAAVRYDEGVHPIYERHLYQRGVHLLVSASHRIRLLQSGSIRAYLAYAFITLLVVMALARQG